jgi:dihydroceramide fatty acyl 2-hydroxylase
MKIAMGTSKLKGENIKGGCAQRARLDYGRGSSQNLSNSDWKGMVLDQMTSVEVDQSEPPRKPFRQYKREQERISRRNLYRTSTLYTSYSAILFVLAARWGHAYRAVSFYLGGVPVWMFIEYFSHRYILHRHFKVSKKWYKRFVTRLANKYLDPLHFGHHEHPFDGNHMSGELRDMLPLFIVGSLVGIFVFPAFTASMVVAGAFQSYVAEEWIHHATHYYNFRDPYFRYMKRHHFYHHTSHGITKGFGTSSGILDAIFKTRYPENVRRRLYGSKRSLPAQRTEQTTPRV